MDDTFYPAIELKQIVTPIYSTVVRHSGRDWQDAETLFFIHNEVTSGRWWEPVMAALEELLPAGYACYAPDLPGQGEAGKAAAAYEGNRAAALLSVLDSLGIKRAHLVGWSLAGGQTALEMALAQPDRYKSLTLVSSTAPLLFAHSAMQNQFLRLEEGIRRGNYESAGQIIRSIYLREGRFPLNGSPPANALFYYLLQCVMQVSSVPQITNPPSLPIPAELGLPVLCVRGESDLLINEAEYKQSQLLWPTGKFKEVVFESGSHTPMVEQPRRFALVLDEFFSQL